MASKEKFSKICVMLGRECRFLQLGMHVEYSFESVEMVAIRDATHPSKA